MPAYSIWTVGCQMNKVDSDRLAERLAGLGLHEASEPRAADVIVLNSCSVRQGAENRVAGHLGSLRSLKRNGHGPIIALMGCMVAPDTVPGLRRRFPYVDLFLPPATYGPLLERAAGLLPDGCRPAPLGSPGPTAYVTVIQGCDKFCSFCIVPYRRGREHSRPMAEIVSEIEALVRRRVREVTLLGQTVDSYGHDLPGGPDLADLLRTVHAVEGLARVRFLTSHPNDMTERIIRAVAELPKVCEHINLPVQSGDDDILRAMRRPYTAAGYLGLVRRIREAISGVALSTDVIVGFPGETEAQFQRTLTLLEEARFDVVHAAIYSPREGTIAARSLPDDVPPEVKKERHHRLEALQEAIAREINGRLVGRTVEVLVEAHERGKWQGRTRTGKLAFFPFASDTDLRGQIVPVAVESASAWALVGRLTSPPGPLSVDREGERKGER